MSWLSIWPVLIRPTGKYREKVRKTRSLFSKVLGSKEVQYPFSEAEQPQKWKSKISAFIFGYARPVKTTRYGSRDVILKIPHLNMSKSPESESQLRTLPWNHDRKINLQFFFRISEFPYFWGNLDTLSYSGGHMTIPIPPTCEGRCPSHFLVGYRFGEP